MSSSDLRPFFIAVGKAKKSMWCFQSNLSQNESFRSHLKVMESWFYEAGKWKKAHMQYLSNCQVLEQGTKPQTALVVQLFVMLHMNMTWRAVMDGAIMNVLDKSHLIITSCPIVNLMVVILSFQINC